MAANTGENQSVFPFQPDQPEAAGKVIFAAVSQAQLAVMGSFASGFFIQRIGLQAVYDPLCPLSNRPFFFTSALHSLKLFSECAGLMDFKSVHSVTFFSYSFCRTPDAPPAFHLCILMGSYYASLSVAAILTAQALYSGVRAISSRPGLVSRLVSGSS